MVIVDIDIIFVYVQLCFVLNVQFIIIVENIQIGILVFDLDVIISGVLENKDFVYIIIVGNFDGKFVVNEYIG